MEGSTGYPRQSVPGGQGCPFSPCVPINFFLFQLFSLVHTLFLVFSLFPPLPLSFSVPLGSPSLLVGKQKPNLGSRGTGTKGPGRTPGALARREVAPETRDKPRSPTRSPAQPAPPPYLFLPPSHTSSLEKSSALPLALATGPQPRSLARVLTDQAPPFWAALEGHSPGVVNKPRLSHCPPSQAIPLYISRSSYVTPFFIDAP